MKILAFVIVCSLAATAVASCRRLDDTDVATRSIRSPAYPNGTHVESGDDCCALCEQDRTCVAAVLQDDMKCWILKAYRGLQGRGTRTTFQRQYTAALPDDYGSRSRISHLTDVTGAVRTSMYPNGVYQIFDVWGCSNACLLDPECQVAVWNMGGGDTCWPLRSFNLTRASGSRAVLWPLGPGQGQGEQPTVAPTSGPSSGGGAGFDGPTCPTCEIP